MFKSQVKRYQDKHHNWQEHAGSTVPLPDALLAELKPIMRTCKGEEKVAPETFARRAFFAQAIEEYQEYGQHYLSALNEAVSEWNPENVRKLAHFHRQFSHLAYDNVSIGAEELAKYEPKLSKRLQQKLEAAMYVGRLIPEAAMMQTLHHYVPADLLKPLNQIAFFDQGGTEAVKNARLHVRFELYEYDYIGNAVASWHGRKKPLADKEMQQAGVQLLSAVDQLAAADASYKTLATDLKAALTPSLGVC